MIHSHSHETPQTCEKSSKFKFVPSCLVDQLLLVIHIWIIAVVSRLPMFSENESKKYTDVAGLVSHPILMYASA